MALGVANELEAAGKMIAEGDTVVAALRNRLTEGPNRRGFYIRIAASASNTTWGPGKQKRPGFPVHWGWAKRATAQRAFNAHGGGVTRNIFRKLKEMVTKQTEEQSPCVSKEKLLGFVRELIGVSRKRDDDEHPMPPSPWDPVIRRALERTAIFERFGDSVALNPQPLPPRYAFLSALAEEMAGRAELLQELADATKQQGTQQGIIIVGGYTGRFVDEWCGSGVRLKWPFPGPPPVWFQSEIHPLDLVVIGARLGQVSEETFSTELRQHLADAGAKFVQAGLSKAF